MKPGLPWSVKGIEPDVREAAKFAARRSGMTLGEWLNSTILGQADGPEPQPPEKPQRGPSQTGHQTGQKAGQALPAFERAASRLEDIAEKLSRISIGESSTASRFGIHAVRSEPGQQDMRQDVQNVLGRVESNERQTVEAFTAVNERLSALSRQLAQSPRAAPPRAGDEQNFKILESAVRNIVEHMEQSERRSKDNFKSLADRIGAIGSKAQSADAEHLLRQAPAFSQLEIRLAELAKRVERSEQSPTHQTLADLLRREITDLAKRIDQVRENSEVLASRAQTQAVQASQQELRAIENRILGLLKEAQASLSGAAVVPAEVQRLRGEIEHLNHRIDEQQGAKGPSPDVLELRSVVEQLSTRVAQGHDMRPLADMDRRILDITQRLEQTHTASQGQPQFADLENRIAELDYRFNEAIAGRASAHSTEIESRIAEVSDRLGRTEQQLASLETIERAVNQLFDTMEQQRKWTEEVAEGAAERASERMAQQVLAAGPQQVSLAGSPEIKALEQGLHAVRAAADTADQRNQETLEAVHETLEQIVNKLTELETAAISQRVAAAAAPYAPEQMEDAPEVGLATPADTQDFEPQGQEHNPFDAQPAISNPFEPQFNVASGMVNQDMAGNPMADGPMAGGDDFIAAARRAAQAAAQQKSILSSIAPGAAKMSEAGSRKLLSLSLFGKKRKVPKPDPHAAIGLTGEIKPPPGFKPANANTDNKRRKLLLMGLVLLAAVSAFTFNIMGRNQDGKPIRQPAAIEQPIDQSKSSDEVEVPESAASPVAPEAPALPEIETSASPATAGAPLDEVVADPLLTGSLPQTLGTPSVSALVSGQAADPQNLPPAEVGNMALREAAALGDANAQFVIATRYLNGERVTQDFEKAAYWYGKAASQGLAPAQYRVATMYERGRGVAKDLAAALGWYERAASLGNVKSMHNAAVLASGNELGDPDYARAFKWFSLGAAHGMKDSQFNLAVLLERGLGAKASRADAYFWYSVAAQQGDTDASKRASALAKEMTQNQLLAAKTRLASWVSDKAPDAANVVAVNSAEWAATPQTGG